MLLVTGGAGFIGSNLVAEILEQGLGPVAICDRFGTDEKWRNCLSRALADVVPPEGLFDWLAANSDKIKAIFHMGACSSTTESDVDFILRSNFTLSLGLWRWCTEHKVPLIYASSAAVYGDGSEGFDDDSDPASLSKLRPLNAYGWSKLLFDKEAVRLAALGEAPPHWAGLRFFNVYGPNEDHKGPQRSVVVQVFERISETGRATLFRSHRPDYADGGQMRDFIWVDDCVSVMLWLLTQPGVSGIFNCGTGAARTFEDLVHATCAAMGLDPAIDFIDTPEKIRDKYQYFTQARMDRLRDAGYRGQSTSLETGVTRYVRDYLATDDRYR